MVRKIGDEFIPRKCPKCNSNTNVKRGLMLYICYCENCGWEIKL